MIAPGLAPQVNWPGYCLAPYPPAKSFVLAACQGPQGHVGHHWVGVRVRGRLKPLTWPPSSP